MVITNILLEPTFKSHQSAGGYFFLIQFFFKSFLWFWLNFARNQVNQSFWENFVLCLVCATFLIVTLVLVFIHIFIHDLLSSFVLLLLTWIQSLIRSTAGGVPPPKTLSKWIFLISNNTKMNNFFTFGLSWEKWINEYSESSTLWFWQGRGEIHCTVTQDLNETKRKEAEFSLF